MISTVFYKEICSRRDLIRELVFKELKIRYSRPLLGFFWAFLSLFLIVIIFYVIFNLFLKVRIEEAPFILLVHLLITSGLVIIFSVLYVRWRDIKYIVDTLLLLLFYLIPGVYSFQAVKGSLPGKNL